MFFKKKVIQLVKVIRNSKKMQYETFALTKLLKMFNDEIFLPLTNWSMVPSEILHICNDIVINKRNSIVELGSGMSTLSIAKIIKIYDLDVVFTCIDNNKEWLDIVEGQLKKFSLEKCVTLIHAPITEIKKDYAKPNQKLWYDTKVIDQVFNRHDEIDLLIVDGPFGGLTPFCRYSAVPFFRVKLSANFAIFLDDTNRKDELEILNDWIMLLNRSCNKVNFDRYSYIHSESSFNSCPILSNY